MGQEVTAEVPQRAADQAGYRTTGSPGLKSSGLQVKEKWMTCRTVYCCNSIMPFSRKQETVPMLAAFKALFAASLAHPEMLSLLPTRPRSCTLMMLT